MQFIMIVVLVAMVIATFVLVGPSLALAVGAVNTVIYAISK